MSCIVKRTVFDAGPRSCTSTDPMPVNVRGVVWAACAAGAESASTLPIDTAAANHRHRIIQESFPGGKRHPFCRRPPLDWRENGRARAGLLARAWIDPYFVPLS